MNQQNLHQNQGTEFISINRKGKTSIRRSVYNKFDVFNFKRNLEFELFVKVMSS